MRRNLPLLSLCFALFFATAAAAQTDKPALKPIPEPPPIPAEGTADSASEGAVIAKPENKVEEIRRNGKLYMIKVTPAYGKPYYLIDREGQGNWTKHDGPTAEVSVPMWVIGTF